MAVDWLSKQSGDPRRPGDIWTADFKTFHVVGQLTYSRLAVSAAPNWRDSIAPCLRSFAGLIWEAVDLAGVPVFKDITHNFNFPSKSLTLDSFTDDPAGPIADWADRELGPRGVAELIRLLADKLADAACRTH